jgi:AAA ATPase domain
VTTLVPERRKGNLPAEVTSFIGRRRELSQVRDALERYRLVTLRGVGGVGKTRLALHLAADLQRSFADRAEAMVPGFTLTAAAHRPTAPGQLANHIGSARQPHRVSPSARLATGVPSVPQRPPSS